PKASGIWKVTKVTHNLEAYTSATAAWNSTFSAVFVQNNQYSKRGEETCQLRQLSSSVTRQLYNRPGRRIPRNRNITSWITLFCRLWAATFTRHSRLS